jgi:hypothetical protein
LSSIIPTGNILSLTYYTVNGAVYSPVVDITMNPATAFFAITVHDELTGSGDLTVSTTTVLDTTWHNINLVVTPSGLTSLSFDTTSLLGGVTYTGTVISGGDNPGRFAIDDTAGATVTSASCLVDKLYIFTQ